MRLAPAAALLIVALAGTTSALGQSWAAPVNGNLNDGTKWNPMGVPGAGSLLTFGQVGAYTATATVAVNYGLNITNAAATVLVSPGVSLFIDSVPTNAGTLQVNDGANVFTQLIINSSLTLNGSGQTLLVAHPTNADSARIGRNGNFDLTIGAGHTLRGSARIYDIKVTNNGTLKADQAGRWLWCNFSNGAQGYVNNALMTAVNGGELRFENVGYVVQNNPGKMLADGGIVTFVSSGLDGGIAETKNTGLIRFLGSTIKDVTITPGSVVTVPAGQLMATNGVGVTNNGQVLINESGDNLQATMRLDANTLFSGTGSVRLNAHPTNADSARINRNGNAGMTIGANQTLRGAGRVYDLVLVNNGLVTADAGGGQWLWCNFSNGTQGWQNNAVMSSINSSQLRFENLGYVTQIATAKVVADGGEVYFLSSGLLGGSVETKNGGAIRFNSSTLNQVTIPTGSQVTVPDGALMAIAGGGTTNHGTILLNEGASNSFTQLRLDGDVLIAGTGQVVLNASSANADSARVTRNGDSSLTIGAGQKLRGTGRVYDLKLINNGLVTADAGSGKWLWCNFSNGNLGWQNNAIMSSVNGSHLRFDSLSYVTQSATAKVVADGGEVYFLSSGLLGGSVETKNGGAIRFSSSTINQVTIPAGSQVTVPDGALMAIAGGGTTNHGTILVNESATNSFTQLRLDGDVLIAGTGQVVLNANAANADSARVTRNGDSSLTIGAGQKLRGTGRVYDLKLINNGLVTADAGSGKWLWGNFSNSNLGWQNNAIISSVNASHLRVENLSYITQSNSAKILADGGEVLFLSSGVQGGTLETKNGGAIRFSSSTINNVTIPLGSQVTVPDGALMAITGLPTVNNGTILVNESGSNNFTQLRIDGDQTLNGTGTLLFNANASNIDSARLTRNGEVGLTTGPQQTIAGYGRLYDIDLAVNGKLSPGGVTPATPVGAFQKDFRTLTLGPSAETIIDVASASSFDQIFGNNTGTYAIDGKLTVRLVGGFFPVKGAQFPIYSAGSISGGFKSFSFPPLGGALIWKVTYTNNQVLLNVTCSKSDLVDIAGANGPDGKLTGADVVAFFTDFFSPCDASGRIPCNKADITDVSGNGSPDGLLTPSDVVLFFQLFFAGCP